ncbi:MAG: PIN domain-containing protein, partial [Desulfobacteraceae bacterium]|nr:PIN domain-containing protein [Desulfobacteraceae bacterium]
QVLPVDLYVASELRNIPREQIPDMPDRIIAAVAQYFNLPLITKDDRIIKADINTIW